MPVPMQPPPYYTPFLDDQRNVAEVWKRFFLSAQTAITFLLQTQQRVGSMQGLMPIEDPADDRFAFVIPGPPGPPGASAPSAAFGAGVMLGSMDVPDDSNTWFPLFPNGTTGAGSVALAINPAFIGVPTAPTPGTTDNSTTLATTAYVTTGIANAIAAVNPAVAVAAATTVILPTTPTYFNGVGGIGATITAGVTNTTLVVDGYTPIVNDRLLVKTEASGGGLGASRNGVYLITQLAALGLAWILTRALDYNQPSDMNSTGAIPVVNGTVNAQTQWVLTSTVNTVGTDAVTFTQFSLNPTTVLNAAGTGLTQTGNSIALTTPVSVTNGGTGANLSGTGGASQVLKQVSAGAGVTVAQLAAADISDYTSGTWTPVIGGATSETGQTYTAQNGQYIKIGKLVHYQGDVVLSAKGTITGVITLKGLPFTSSASVPSAPGFVGYWSGMTTAVAYLSIIIDINATSGTIYGTTGAVTAVGAFVTGDISNTTRFIMAGTYVAA